MKRNKIQAKHPQQPDNELDLHLKALGLGSVDEYRDWCIRQGFVSSLRKHRKQRAQEIRHAESLAAKRIARRRKTESRNPIDTIVQICHPGASTKKFAQEHWKQLVKVIHQSGRDEFTSPHTFVALCRHLHDKRTGLLNGLPVVTALGKTFGNTFLSALTLIAAHRSNWIRPLKSWKPNSHNPRRQFTSLIRHLFDKYGEIPPFFDTVWFLGRTAEGLHRRKWYLHVGAGHRFSQCDLPITYNRQMERNFLSAPDHLTLDQAIRWGQILGHGGDESLAQAILQTRLGHQFENEEFWATVIQWFSNHPMLDRDEVGPVIDYLHHQRFVTAPRNNQLVGANEPPLPAEPNLSMKGRTPRSLLRQVHRWHRELSRSNLNQVHDWEPTGIQPFELAEGNAKEGNLRTWTIRELLSSKSLHTEGRKLKHCVSSYALSCARGANSIWTLEVESNGTISKLITIQVRNEHRVICQARGKLNRRTTEQELKIIARWASAARLTLGTV